jgi:chemotaxis protein methyltransferase CheR
MLLEPLQNQTISDREFEGIRDLVYQHCRIRLHDGKKELVQARVGKRMRTCGFSNTSDYLAHVLADKSGREFTELIDAISTNLTSFFREGGHFDFVERTALPALLKQRKPPHPRIRAWSAGCSTGEEAYSLAMVLRDALGEQTLNVKILATDISRRVLRIARQGVYDEQKVAAVPEPRRNRHFVRGRRDTDQGLCVVPQVRGMVQFHYLNLADLWPFSGPLDFIFCRNVMIYFDRQTQEELVSRFWNCLAPGGYLFTGHSESLSGFRTAFRFIQPTVYRK